MKTNIYTLTCLLFLLNTKSLSQAGMLDNSFDGDGKLSMYVSLPLKTHANAMIIQPNGKIVVVGRVSEDLSGTDHDFLVMRYNTNGTLDHNFGYYHEGQVISDFYGDDQAVAVAIQPDGKIIVAGSHSRNDFNTYHIVLARYNASGTEDETFNGDGHLTMNDIEKSSASAVAVQPDGKIVVAGSANGSMILLRLNSNGTIDNAFGSAGVVTNNAMTTVAALALQPDGKILVSGTRSGFVLTRYNIDGTPDDTFSADGIVTQTVHEYSGCRDMALQPDGKIILVGYGNDGLYDSTVLIRYRSNGNLDKSFDTDGMMITGMENTGYIQAVALQADGKILLAGQLNSFSVSRYNANGSRDNVFNAGNTVTTAVGRFSAASAIAVQPNGRIVVVGNSNSYGDESAALVRYNTNGSISTGFSPDGIIITNIEDAAGKSYCQAVAVQADGKILAAGSLYDGYHYRFFLSRFNVDGTPDAYFGSSGSIVCSGNDIDYFANSLAIQPDGKIILGGKYSNGTGFDFVVARFTPEGIPDRTFNNQGFVVTSIGSSDDICYGVAVQADGKIIAVGDTYTGTSNDFAIIRYLTGGIPDGTFSLDGIVTTDVSGGKDFARAICLQADGKIIVGGYAFSASASYDFAVLRYKSNGDPDLTFNNTGKITLDFNKGSDRLLAMKLQADGKIAVVGISYNAASKNNDIAVARLIKTGLPDKTFSTDGKETTALDGNSQDYATALAVQSDGKIIAGGSTNRGTSDKSDFALVRYTYDGKPDSAGFGYNGRTITDFNHFADSITSIAIQPDGKLIAAGIHHIVSGPFEYYQLVIARYHLNNNFTFTGISQLEKADAPPAVNVFPNPLFSNGVISFASAKNAEVTIDMLDENGRTIKNLAKKEFGTGIHQVQISKEGLTPGIYFLRILIDKHIVTKKVIIN